MSLFQINRVLERVTRGWGLSRGMSVPTVLFCISLVLALTISQGNGQMQNQQNQNAEGKKGIMCYVCNSARDPRCGDPFDSSTIEKVDCDQYMPDKNTTSCRKNVQKATLGSRVDHRVIRTCGYIDEPARYQNEDDEDVDTPTEGRCYNKAGTFEVMVTYCACKTDGCNPAPRQARSSLTLVSQTGLQLATMIAGSYLMLNKKPFY